MSFKVIIPARFASTRLPGKALLDIGGKPMVQHVYERARASDAAEVMIATDDERIRDCALGFGATVHMTAESHPSGTDRLAQVVRERGEARETVVVNVQGDEPMIAPALINQVAALLDTHRQASVSTLCEVIDNIDAVFDPSVVKVVFDEAGYALYFSRAAIPWHRAGFSDSRPDLPARHTYYRHLGIYAYRVRYLLEFVNRAPSSLELTESLEQLRVLSYGERIAIAAGVEATGPGIDTPADLERVRALIDSCDLS